MSRQPTTGTLLLQATTYSAVFNALLWVYAVLHTVLTCQNVHLFIFGCREIEEQLADALYKRSQAKLMADPDQANVESALADALKALTLYAEDDDYYMVVSTCYMRLNRYEEARKMLETVLERSPKNYKALYHHAFCQRASGSQRDAIEGLTKVGVPHT
jgi:tetratricopeptide (TPR) repeat protein